MRKFQPGDVVVNINSADLAIVRTLRGSHVDVSWIDYTKTSSGIGFLTTSFRFATRDEALRAAALMDEQTRKVATWQPPKPPIKEGDQVRNTNGGRGTVLAIREVGNETKAWVQWSSGNNNTWSLKNLTLIEEKKEDCNCD